MPLSQPLTSTNVTVNVVDRVKRKEKSYREPIEKNHDCSFVLAETLRKDGEIEKVLMQAADGMDESFQQELRDFLNQQRERLKQVSVQNVKNAREIDTFMGALDMIRAEAVNNNNNNNEPPNYDELVTTKMEQTRATRANMQLDIQDERMCREIRRALGEKEDRRRARRGRNNDEESDDEELEIVNDGGVSLKCPITSQWFEEPIKSKSCNHTYSKAGLIGILGSGARATCKCPWPGCPNQQLSLAQCEPDRQMEMKVKKQRRREERETQIRLTQAAGVDSDDEEL
jgi:SUMO ligase MMS21 Smc5/6 complex component